jgi:cytochrome c oxidase subunit II
LSVRRLASATRRAALLGGLLAVLAGLAGCGADFQSALHPAGEDARRIAESWWVMLAVYGAVFLATLGLLLAALAAGRRERPPDGPPGGATRFVVVAGIVVPAAILLAMLVYSLALGLALRPPETALTIEVTGHQFWWDVRYPDHGVVTANEIHVPAGEPTRLLLRSADVVHSFWAPNLQGKMDLLPDEVNRFWLRPERPGTFRGQCAEFCGASHALMAFDVVVRPKEEHERWLAERAAPRPEPADPRARRGREVFLDAGCAACHAVRGTPAVARLGPDLTHVGSRRALGAGTTANDAPTLARWIAAPHAVKPGNRMPPSHLPEDDLEALVAWLGSLR